MNDSVYKIADKYYRVSAEVIKEKTKQTNAIPDGLIDYTTILHYVNTGHWNKNFNGTLYGEHYRTVVSLRPIESININFSFPKKAARLHLQDAPYDMFAIPYTTLLNIYDSNNQYIKYDNPNGKEIALAVATQIATALGGTNGHIYDMQMLPYFPGGEFENLSNNTIKIATNSYNIIGDNN